MLIDGHLRAETTPDSEVPVLVLDVSEDGADKILLTLDPLASMATADSARIQSLLETVQTGSQAVEDLLRRTAGEQVWALVHPHDVAEPPTQIDRAAEFQKKWGTKEGQLSKIGSHRLLCGDTSKAEDVGRLMAEERAVLFVTDPPYAVGYTGGSHPQSWGSVYLTQCEGLLVHRAPVAASRRRANASARWFKGYPESTSRIAKQASCSASRRVCSASLQLLTITKARSAPIKIASLGISLSCASSLVRVSASRRRALISEMTF
jgi:hypothetical protein